MTERALTPADSLRRLEEGNARFVGGDSLNRDLPAEVEKAAGGQRPFAAILGCMDSRVPPELVFDQGLGDLFVLRVAGNFVNRDILGSLEFATKVAGSNLIVVLGHSACGAVKGACDDVQMGLLTGTLTNLHPAIEAVPGFEGERNSANPAFVQAVAEANVRHAAAEIPARSDVLRELSERGEIQIAGAIYSLSTGLVRWMD